ncbi:hypothetical protein Trydic_g7309 [Trypoxylus dichotomus]
MIPFQVQVLYDFVGEPNTSELSIVAGEVLTVTRDDVGEGWWEGRNSKGVCGLFPESYVERINSVPPALPPTNPLPPVPTYQSVPPVYDNDFVSNTGSDDDDWDDYSDAQNNQAKVLPYNQAKYDNSRYPNDDNISESNFGDGKGTAHTKKNLNRFSTFVKSGGESYILGELKVNIALDERVVISKHDEVTYSWPQILNPYTVHITSPKKESKLKGLKSFIAYQLTPSFNNIQVSRRYKHFDWLHERLLEKFSIMAVPPLPDKQISGRYEDQFIEHRRLQLQEFVNYVSKHPIFSSSEVWFHFLKCTDEKQWKQGKRRAERDPLLGANYCLTIQAPEKELMSSIVDSKIDANLTFVQNLDSAIKNLMTIAVDQMKKHQGPYKREFSRISESFHRLGFALSSEEKSGMLSLPSAITNIGVAYSEIALYYEEQPKYDWEPLSNTLYLYKGLTSAFPEIFALHKGAQQKRRECEKNNMPPAELNEIRRRSDVLTYAIFAEMNHFKIQRSIDLKAATQSYLREQINFYKKIVTRLEQTLVQLDDC